jgi:hypothetical protein
MIVPISLLALTPKTLTPSPKSNTEYESEINLAPQECLQLITSTRSVGNAWRLKFYNVCGVNLYANACLEESPGKFKLHKSGARIPKNGYWDLFSYGGGKPLSMALATGRGSPAIPGMCAIEKKK